LPTPYIAEPNPAQLFSSLLPVQLRMQVYAVLADSLASEFGARMTAMDNATRNAGEMISNMTLQANRLRQAAITKELMEIIGGAEALKG
jgi:F-type H+-transporting ATPase subunit gamma